MHPELLNILRAGLDETDSRRLRDIREPITVGVPPEDAMRSLSVRRDGEIRCYGRRDVHLFDDPGTPVYLSSRDCGLSWKWREPQPDDIGPCFLNPYTGDYVRVCRPEGAGGSEKPGSVLYAVIENPDGRQTRREIPGSERCIIERLPQALVSRRRLLCTCQVLDGGVYHPVVLRSDDDGLTWQAAHLSSAPRHTVQWPHKGLRWQNGACEPTVAERPDGSLLLLARTSQDVHYQSESFDGGETWSALVPSNIHATLTMPTLFRLSDGRILLFWCNTQPLPELDHHTQWPALNEGEISGERGEDVFTNRDANHAAISEDGGCTWIGFRELALNPLRNAADFRVRGGNEESLDKSIHQFQAVELPYGKVLLCYGQHPACRRLLIFDPAWLYETGRREDFRRGLGSVSTQVYLKSVSGNFRGVSGHCAWNRTNGAVLVPDPDGNFEEALLIAHIPDIRLLSGVQGMVWNFPASAQGEVTLRLQIAGKGLRLSLCDRWFNPSDVTVEALAAFSTLLTRDEVSGGVWSTVSLRWDLEAGDAVLTADGQTLRTLPLQQQAPNGLCYLHLQSVATADPQGSLIKWMEKRV